MYKKLDKSSYDKADKLNKKIGQTSGQVIGEKSDNKMGHGTLDIKNRTLDITNQTSNSRTRNLTKNIGQKIRQKKLDKKSDKKGENRSGNKSY